MLFVCVNAFHHLFSFETDTKISQAFLGTVLMVYGLIIAKRKPLVILPLFYHFLHLVFWVLGAALLHGNSWHSVSEDALQGHQE